MSEAIQKPDISKNDNILSVEHLSMRFGGLIAINDLSFDVKRAI